MSCPKYTAAGARVPTLGLEVVLPTWGKQRHPNGESWSDVCVKGGWPSQIWFGDR